MNKTGQAVRGEKKAKLFVISGPAGSGKTTLAQALLEAFSQTLGRVVTATTRAARPGEQNGRDYFFLERADFEKRAAAGEFFEYAQVHGNLYGSLKSEVLKKLETGRDLILVIDVQGACALRRFAAENPQWQGRVETVFIRPPSMEELKRRLLGRGAIGEAELARRLETALAECPRWREFDFSFESATRQADRQAIFDIYRARSNLACPCNKPDLSAYAVHPQAR